MGRHFVGVIVDLLKTTLLHREKLYRDLKVRVKTEEHPSMALAELRKYTDFTSDSVSLVNSPEHC